MLKTLLLCGELTLDWVSSCSPENLMKASSHLCDQACLLLGKCPGWCPAAGLGGLRGNITDTWWQPQPGLLKYSVPLVLGPSWTGTWGCSAQGTVTRGRVPYKRVAEPYVNGPLTRVVPAPFCVVGGDCSKNSQRRIVPRAALWHAVLPVLGPLE